MDQKGKILECHALLDSCSQSNFITSALAEGLCRPTETSALSVSGIGGILSEKLNYSVDCIIKS